MKIDNLVWLYKFISISFKRITKLSLISYLLVSIIVALLESKAVIQSSQILNYSGNLIEKILL